MMLIQAVLQALVEPGIQKMTVLLAIPANARDCKVLVPISIIEKCLNNSPKPSTCLSNNTLTASGVLSLPEKPVPPVIKIACTCELAIHAETVARIW